MNFKTPKFILNITISNWGKALSSSKKNKLKKAQLDVQFTMKTKTASGNVHWKYLEPPCTPSILLQHICIKIGNEIVKGPDGISFKFH